MPGVDSRGVERDIVEQGGHALETRVEGQRCRELLQYLFQSFSRGVRGVVVLRTCATREE